MRLLLHAGTHKTGTSTIQRVLHEEREELRASGIWYPDAGRHFGDSPQAHHPFAHAVRDNLEAARTFVEHIAAGAQPEDVVLLSAEPVYRHVLRSVEGGWWRRHRAYLDRLSQLLADEGFQVEVVLVFRRRDQFVESIYHERVAHGFGKSFEQLIERAGRLLDYDQQTEQFRGAFPAVSTLDYANLSGDDLVPAFLRALGLEPPVLQSTEWERRSTDARLSLWMARSYRENPDEELVTQRRRFSKSPSSNKLFDDWGQVTLWPDEASRRALLEEYGSTASVDDDRRPAVLTPELEDRIDDAFDAYLVAKGLEPTNRRARRRSAS